MKALIIGASGLVGSYLQQACQTRNWQVEGTYCQFARSGLIPLQLTDTNRVRSIVHQSQPDIVFLPAFRSHVDYCQQHPEETDRVNIVGSLNVAKATGEIGAKLVFYSSDYVFDGKSGAYRETDIPNPICVYGEQKLIVEQKIPQLLEDYLILRVTVVYGHEAQGKNFVDRLVRTLKVDREIKVPRDQIGSPTLVNDIAEASCRLVEADARGLFHVAGSDLVSRYQFALEVAKVFELPTTKIVPVTTAELRQIAPRPLEAGMICDKLASTLNWQCRGISDGISYLKQVRGRDYVHV